jgi:hypothetical protein
LGKEFIMHQTIHIQESGQHFSLFFTGSFDIFERRKLPRCRGLTQYCSSKCFCDMLCVSVAVLPRFQ